MLLFSVMIFRPLVHILPFYQHFSVFIHSSMCLPVFSISLISTLRSLSPCVKPSQTGCNLKPYIFSVHSFCCDHNAETPMREITRTLDELTKSFLSFSFRTQSSYASLHDISFLFSQNKQFKADTCLKSLHYFLHILSSWVAFLSTCRYKIETFKQ